MTFTKQQVEAAAIALPVLQNTISAIETLQTGIASQLTEPELKLLKACEATLRNHSIKFNSLVSAARERMADLRPLFTEVVSGMSRIASELEAAKARRKGLIDSHSVSVGKLKEMGFDAAKIAYVEPYPQAHVDEFDAKIEQLTIELESVERFVTSSPALDVSLLNGTRFEQPLINQQAAA